MEFKTKDSVYDFIENKTTYLNCGSQGECYTSFDKREVYKFYYNFLDPMDEDVAYCEDEVLKFSHVKSNLVVFPHDVIKLNDEVIGDVTRYAKAPDLYSVNPLNVNLDRLMRLVSLALKEIELVTKEHVKMHGVMYNILFGSEFYIIDTIEFSKSEQPYRDLSDINKQGFNIAIVYFLIDGLFNEVLKNDSFIMEIYESNGKQVPLLTFINAVRRRLSELVGHEIKTLSEARKYLNKNPDENCKYLRILQSPITK